jgi:hypothetical protein
MEQLRNSQETCDNGFSTVASLEESGSSESRKCRSGAPLAEGVGLEPTSPCGQRFSSYEYDVLTLPASAWLCQFVQVDDESIS